MEETGDIYADLPEVIETEEPSVTDFGSDTNPVPNVGDIVEVYWPLDKIFYSGTVHS